MLLYNNYERIEMAVCILSFGRCSKVLFYIIYIPGFFLEINVKETPARLRVFKKNLTQVKKLYLSKE